MDWSETATKILEERYLWRDKDGRLIEDADGMCWRVANAIAEAERNYGGDEGTVRFWANKFYEMLRERLFLSGSALMNAGNPRQSMSACWTIPIDDSIDSIFGSMRDAAIVMRDGGGVGFSFSRLRAGGTIVSSSNGPASGPLPFLRAYDGMVESILEGGRRRGAAIGLLRVDHPDILTFISCKKDANVYPIRNFNISVSITDAFMQAVKEGTDYSLIDPRDGREVGRLSAQKVFSTIAENAWATGDPGLFFIDKVNASLANPVPSLGPIESCNPCAIGSTLVATVNGWRRADDIQAGDMIGTVLDTGTVQRVDKSKHPTFRVRFGDGAEIYVTAGHQFYTRTERPNHMDAWDPKDFTFIPTCLKDMKVGDEVRVGPAPMPNNPVPNKPEHLTDHIYGLLAGLMLSRGAFIIPDHTNPFLVLRLGYDVSARWIRDLRRILQEQGGLGIETVVGSDIMQISGRPLRHREQYLCVGGKIINIVRRFTEKHVSLECQNTNREFLTGLLDGLFSCDAEVCTAERQFMLRLRVNDIEMGRDIRRILLMFGIHAEVRKPFRVESQVGYDVRVDGENLKAFYREIGLSHPAKATELRKVVRDCFLSHESWLTTITGIEPAETEDVYDIHEPTTDTWITEGIVSRGCVDATTVVLTNKGYQKIDALVGQSTSIWNGEEFVNVVPRITGYDQPMLHIEFSDGNYINCTHYHRFCLNDGSVREARHLQVGDGLAKWKFPIIDGSMELSEQDAYTRGFFSGDGHERRGHANVIQLYGEKRKLLEFIEHETYTMSPSRDIVHVTLRNVSYSKTFVPHYDYTIVTKLNWLAGLIDSDGTLNSKKGAISISSINKEFLVNVQYLLNTLGIHAPIVLMKKAGNMLLPDGNGGRKIYHCKDCYRLTVAPSHVEQLLQMGMRTHRVNPIIRYERKVSCTRFVRVASIRNVSNNAKEVYCFTEPKRHIGVFNGLATMQCGEQPLYPYENCALCNIDLAKVTTRYGVNYKHLGDIVHVVVRFLDNLLEVNHYPLPQSKEIAFANRRIGVGVMGWADALIKMHVSYASEKALALAEEVMSFITKQAMIASEQLAIERGEFPNWSSSIYNTDSRYRKLRNASVTTIPPCGTVSILGSTSSGIEPLFALSMTHTAHGRVLHITDQALVDVLTEEGLYKDDLREYIERTGTVAGFSGLPEWVYDVCKTAHEISPEWHVRMQAAWQKHVTASISKCLVGDTLLPTSEGLKRIDAFYRDDAPDTFRSCSIGLAGEGKHVTSDYFYYGGRCSINRLLLKTRIEVAGTPNHRIRVFDSVSQSVVWRELGDICVGDRVPLAVGTRLFGNQYSFSSIYGHIFSYKRGTHHKKMNLPRKITTDLARWLGYMTANGWVLDNTISFCDSNVDVTEDFAAIVKRRFGIMATIKPSPKSPKLIDVRVHGQELVAFMGYLGVHRGAAHKCVPECIKQSGEKIQAQFIRGLTLDGYVSKTGRKIVVTSMSETLCREVQMMLLNMGIACRLHRKQVDYEYAEGSEKHEWSYELALIPRYERSFDEMVGFAEKRNRRVGNLNKDNWDGIPFGMVQSAIVELCKNKQKTLPHGISTVAGGTLSRILRCNEFRDTITYSRLQDMLVLFSEYQDTPAYQVIMSVARDEVFYDEVITISSDMADVYDVSVPTGHAFVGNGVINHNTINLPSTATVSDVEKIYQMAYDLGCMGITVFRDGCKGEQVLTHGTKNNGKKQEQEVLEVQPLHSMERPTVLQGTTQRLRAPEGTCFITINEDTDGPTELFCIVGKAGSAVTAFAEGMGRLLSYTLSLPSPVSKKERAAEIVEQLTGIGGRGVMGFGANQILSVPDAIAKALTVYLGNGQQALPPANEHRGTDLCPACGQPTWVREEGCSHCLLCGESRC